MEAPLIDRRVEVSSSWIFFANRFASGAKRNPVFPSTTVSRYPPSSVARTHLPAAMASTGVMPKSSSTAVVTRPRQVAYKSTSATTTDVFADRDDSIGVRDRTMVEWALEPDPKARREPSHRAEALDQGFVLIVEHPRRREAVVEVRVVMSGGVHGPVPQDQIEIVIRESRPTELPCRVELFQGRSAPQRPQVDHIDIRESGPGRERGIRIRRQEVRAEVLGKGQGHAFTTPDCLQKIVQHGDSHARPPTPSRLAGDPRAGRQRASHHARTASRNET